MDARSKVIDLFLFGGNGSQPEFEKALDEFEAATLRRGAKEIATARQLNHLLLVTEEELLEDLAMAVETGE